MASMVSAPATIPATNTATFTTGFDPADPGTRTWAPTSSWSPARSANASTGTRPAHETRFGSSKPAETLWNTLAYRMSFCLVLWSSQQVPSSQVRRTFVVQDQPARPNSSVHPGSGIDELEARPICSAHVARSVNYFTAPEVMPEMILRCATMKTTRSGRLINTT